MASMLSALLTKKPTVPAFHPVDFGALQTQAATENLALLPKLQPLAEAFNKMSIAEMNQAMEQALPGYSNLRDTTTGTIQSLAEGKIPADVEAGIRRRAAERGISLGTSGSDFSEFDTERNLGLTSLQLSEQGISAASQWINAAAARTPTFNFASMFITPTQRVQIREQEAQFQFQRDWLAAKIKAIPSGGTAALINLSNDIESIGRSVLSAYAGGAMGGGGGGGMMGGGGGGGGSPAAAQYGGGGTLNPASEGLSSWAEY